MASAWESAPIVAAPAASKAAWEAAPVVEGPSAWEKAKHYAKLGASAIGRGVASLPALAMDLNLIDPETGKPVAGMPFSDKVRSTGEQPQTRGEQYFNSATEGVAGALTGSPAGAVAPVRSAVTGLGSGIGAEAAAGVSDNPLARLFGGLAGGLGSGFAASKASAARPQSTELAKEALEGIPQEALLKAQMLQQRARAQGVDMDLAQALEGVGVPASNLTAIRDRLAQSRHGNKVQASLRGQPGQLDLLAGQTEAALPGPVTTMPNAANRVASAATKAVDSARTARTNAVRPFYEQAGEAPALRKVFADRLSDELQNPQITSQAAVQIKDALERLQRMEATGAPATHALEFNTLLKELQGPFKGNPLTPLDAGTKAILQRVAGDVRAELQEVSPSIRAGDAKYAQISRDVVDPLKQGPTGQVAGKAGYKGDTQTPVARLEAIFNRGSDGGVKEASRDIVRLERELRGVDPEAFPAAVKAFIRDRINRSMESTVGTEGLASGSTAGGSADKLWHALFANQAQWQGMRDMAAGVARAKGLPEAEVVRGLENLAQISRSLRNRPGKVGGLSSEDITQIGGKSQTANVARVYGFLPFERVARKIEDATMAKTFTEFDNILTSPDGANMLRELGKVSVMSPKAITILGTFLGTVPQAEGSSPGIMAP